MRKVVAFTWNILRLELNDPISFVFFLVLPIVFTVIIGLGLGGSRDPNADRRAVLAVTDEDQTALSAELLAALSVSQVLRPELHPVSEAADLFENGRVSGILSIPNGFSDVVLSGQPIAINLKTEPGTTQVAQMQAVRAVIKQVSTAVVASLASVREREKIEEFASEAERQAYFDASMVQARGLLENPPTSARMAYASYVSPTSADGFEQSSPGQLVTWVLVTLLGAAEVFVDERLGGTWRRLLVTPTRRATIMAGKVSGWLVLGLIQMILLVGFGALVLKVNWGRSPLALALILVTFGLAAVSLGVMVGAFVKTRSQAGGLRTMLAMLLAALGGAWWPLEITPQVYQDTVKILPSTWAMIGFNNVILRGQGVLEVLPQAIILLAFSAVFLGIGVWKLQKE